MKILVCTFATALWVEKLLNATSASVVKNATVERMFEKYRCSAKGNGVENWT
jgi:hypothetical protein